MLRFSLPLLFPLLLALPASAQTPAKLDWPRTFTGQPDFAFTRDEALAEARARAARSNTAAPQLPTILTLAADETPPDPLRLRPALAEAVLQGEASPESWDATQADSAILSAALPVYATPTVPDTTEFKATLGQAITRAVAAWQPDASRYNLGDVIQTLTLQAVVTSPKRYAVINNTRYEEGGSFLMRVPLSVPDSEIIAALNREMPASGSFDDASMAAYTTAYEDALAAFASARTANPQLGQQALNIPVVVRQIDSRSVDLEVQGKVYPLRMLYRY